MVKIINIADFQEKWKKKLMIQKKQLKKLVWSEELINEVIQVLRQIDNSVIKVKNINKPFDNYYSCNSIKFNSTHPNTIIKFYIRDHTNPK